MGIFSKKDNALTLLNKLANKNEWQVLSDIKLSVGEKELFADYIVLTKMGAIIFKKYEQKGSMFYNDEKGDWTYIDKDNNKSYIANPIIAVKQIEDEIRRIFAKEQVYKTEVEGFALFMQNRDKALTIYAPERLPYLRVANLGKLFKSAKYLKDKGISPKAMGDAILKHKV